MASVDIVHEYFHPRPPTETGFRSYSRQLTLKKDFHFISVACFKAQRGLALLWVIVFILYGISAKIGEIIKYESLKIKYVYDLYSLCI